MKNAAVLLAILCLSAPAGMAQGAPPSDTLQAVTKHGIILKIPGMDIPVTYTADGKWSAPSVAATGVWRIEGDKLCSKPDVAPAEECVAYPPGKKSGDSFEVTGAQGTATIKIN